jgi:hypothetical protein
MSRPKPSRRTLLGTLLLGLFGLSRTNKSTAQPPLPLPAPIPLPVPLARLDPSGYRTTFTYDSVWGMSSSMDGQPSTTTTYHGLRNVGPAGSVTTYIYDASGRPPTDANG